MEAATTASWSLQAVLGDAPDLPRGPHSLTRDEVAASQRGRLLAAAGELAAETGYAAMTITAIAKRAGVSPNVFYEHFESKLQCFLAAYERFASALLAKIATAVDPDADWQEWVAGTLRCYLDSIDAAGSFAQGFLIEIDACGPEGRSRRRSTYAAFAAVLEARHSELRKRDPKLGPLPRKAFMGFAHGIRELVRDGLEAEPRRPLREIEPDVLGWVAAAVAGAADGAAQTA